MSDREEAVGSFRTFSTINKAIAAGHSNIKVVTDIIEDETIYIEKPLYITIDKDATVFFKQKDVFIFNGGSLMISGHELDLGALGTPNHDEEWKSSISLQENCRLISPIEDSVECPTLMTTLRVECPGKIFISGNRITMHSNLFDVGDKLHVGNTACSYIRGIHISIRPKPKPGQNIKRG